MRHLPNVYSVFGWGVPRFTEAVRGVWWPRHSWPPHRVTLWSLPASLGRTDVEDELPALKPEELGTRYRLGAGDQPPKSTHPSVSANAIAAHLIQVHDKKFKCQVRMQGRTFLQQMSDKGLPHPFTEEEIAAALQKTKPATTPGYDNIRVEFLKNLGLPHLAVQIFPQNHGYTFHPEDLEKGQGDSHWKTW